MLSSPFTITAPLNISNGKIDVAIRDRQISYARRPTRCSSSNENNMQPRTHTKQRIVLQHSVAAPPPPELREGERAGWREYCIGYVQCLCS